MLPNAVYKRKNKYIIRILQGGSDMVKLELYSVRDGIVQEKAGLNWGFSDGHVCIDDAYVAITHAFIKKYPTFFPTTGEIDVIWDDNTEMRCSVEGTQCVNDKTYSKQLTSADDKSVFGSYIRKRMGIPSGTKIEMKDLDKYGRRDIDVEKIGNNMYRIDFSV